MRQALELALEALESAEPKYTKQRADQKKLGGSLNYWKLSQDQRLKAITAIKEALAQPEQEPVATLDDLEQEIYENTRQFVSRDVMEWMLKRYYTTPPQRKPLTDEQIEQLEQDTCAMEFPETARAIEAAHGIKE
jgi:hypothetical protein